VAGALVAFSLLVGAGPQAFAALVAVFILAWISTRVGYAHKKKLGTAEKHDGRTASQVLANLGMAAICALLYVNFHSHLVLLLMVFASLSEAAADTVSSEIGQARGDQARLITTWKSVRAGTDGGVTTAGTIAGSLAAACVSCIAIATILPRSWIGISIIAAIIGMLADSVLGASLERRGLLNNDAVNFFSTIIAALVAFAIA
jgi:uncharacterized protein (TIGR00297 family)